MARTKQGPSWNFPNASQTPLANSIRQQLEQNVQSQIPRTPRPPVRGLIATLEGPSDPQDGSVLFTKIPPEIRNRIFAFALKRYDDIMHPYPDNAYYYRPGYHYPQRLDTALLATCRRIYSETHDLPVSLNEHVFWGSKDRAPPNISFPESPDLYFRQMTLDQRKAVGDIHLFTQLFWLEGSFPSACAQMNPKHLKITIRHADWWFWENNTRLVMKSKWTNNLKAIKELESLEVELEAMERDKDQLEAIVKNMNTWKIDLDEGRKLTAEGNEIVRERYLGQACFSNGHANIYTYNSASNRWEHPRTPPKPTPQIHYVVSTLRWTAK